VGDGLYDTMVDVIVRPSYQGQGIGKTLINKLLEHIKGDTPVGGRVSIQLIAEKGKEPFYEQLGFKRIPHENCGSGMRKVYLNYKICD
jgi:GNAT superfamily N-acetyltransferase